MTTGRELVQFRLVSYVSGNLIPRNKDEEFFDPPLFFGLPEGKTIDDVLEPVEQPPDEQLRSSDQMWRVTAPFTWIHPVTYLGECADFSGVEEEVNNTSAVETFSDALPEIVRLAEAFGWKYTERTIGHDGVGTIAVITVWHYTSEVDYWGEFDCWIDLVGAMRLGDVKILDAEA